MCGGSKERIWFYFAVFRGILGTMVFPVNFGNVCLCLV